MNDNEILGKINDLEKKVYSFSRYINEKNILQNSTKFNIKLLIYGIVPLILLSFFVVIKPQFVLIKKNSMKSELNWGRIVVITVILSVLINYYLYKYHSNLFLR